MAVTAQSVVTIYAKKNVSASHFIYDSNNSAGTNDGWVESRAEDVTVQCRVATKTNASNKYFIYRVEGRFDARSRPASIYCNRLAAKQDIDQLIYVNERVMQVRLGVKMSAKPASPLASPCIVYGGVCLTEY